MEKPKNRGTKMMELEDEHLVCYKQESQKYFVAYYIVCIGCIKVETVVYFLIITILLRFGT
jgi:hypothetical protein